VKEPNRQLKAAKDASERREAELASLSEKKFRLLADAIPHLAWIARADGYIYWYNERFYQYTGATPEQVEGWGWKSVHDPDVLPAAMERWLLSIETGEPFDMTFPLRATDGQFRPFLTRVMPLHDSEGRVLQWFGTNTEITEQKAMEEALCEAKADAERANGAKTKFLAAASHDLRQPVQSLVLLLSVAERQVAGQPKIVETIKTMKAALDGLNGLLTATLDISRLDAGVVAPVMESVDLGARVRRLDAEYTPKASNKGLGFRAPPQGARVRTDPALLERALRNLIENAMRYTLKGGVLVGLRRRDGLVRIDVVDTGVGIPADKRAEVFEEFFQLHNTGRDLGEGLGLGLAIVDRLARPLGARSRLCRRSDAAPASRCRCLSTPRFVRSRRPRSSRAVRAAAF
jgi:two-component system, sensor histidine kinase